MILCIVSSTGIFIIFKSLDKLGVTPFPVIVINYLVASVLGFLINSGQVSLSAILEKEWLPVSLIIGFLFILMFFIVAYSSSKAGISVTTIASKMSVIFPIIFSLIIDPDDRLTPIKTTAIFCTMAGVGMTVYKPREGAFDPAVIYLPLILFFGMGLVDSLVKFAQQRFVGNNDTALFSAILFLNAFVSGIAVLIFYPGNYGRFLKPSTWGWGIILGGVNFGSIFFLVRALNFISREGKSIESSVVFGINNIGVVALSVMVGLLGFRERLKPLNWLGITLSILAIIFFAIDR